jgi:hypothetical protein
MPNKLGPCLLLMCAFLAGASNAAYAQRQAPSFRTVDDTRQTVNFTIGRFSPRPEDVRVLDDVLVANLGGPQFLDFAIDDFKSTSFGIEWLFPVGRFVEMGPGIAFSQRTVRTAYSDLFDDVTLEPIEQDLKLRLIPMSFTARVIPVPPSFPLQPYVGVGITLLNWRYQEGGEFVNLSDLAFDGDCLDADDNYLCVYETAEDEPFEGKGNELVPVFLGGVRVAGSGFAVGAELRYHKGEGELPQDQFPYGSAIDLGGWTFQGTIGVRF